MAEAGEFEVLVGSSSRDIHLRASFNLRDELAEPKKEARLHVGSPLRLLLEDAGGRAVLSKYVGEYMDNPQLELAWGMSLQEIAGFVIGIHDRSGTPVVCFHQPASGIIRILDVARPDPVRQAASEEQPADEEINVFHDVNGEDGTCLLFAGSITNHKVSNAFSQSPGPAAHRKSGHRGFDRVRVARRNPIKGDLPKCGRNGQGVVNAG